MASPTENNKYTAQVQIWNPDVSTGRCGHTAVTLVKETGEKVAEENHLGFWPKYGFKVNLFTLWASVLGSTTTHRNEDMERESDNDEFQQPSHIYEINLSQEQYFKMEDRLKEEKERIDSGKTTYCLTPRIALLKFLQIFASPLVIDHHHSCPITDQLMDHHHIKEDVKEFLDISSENCATLVAGVLKAGDISLNTSKIGPWRYSPLGVNSQLNKLSKTRSDISLQPGSKDFSKKSGSEFTMNDSRE